MTKQNHNINININQMYYYFHGKSLAKSFLHLSVDSIGKLVNE